MSLGNVGYIDPFSISILRSFTINLYQLFLNANKNGKINKVKVGMSAIKRESMFNVDFTADLFEI